MMQWIRGLCVLSLLCGLVLCLCPEGGGKRILRFVGSVVLLAYALKSFKGLDWELYAAESAQIRQRQESFFSENQAVLRSLDRTVIEESYNAYILDMAHSRGYPLQQAKVTAQWSMEGYWVPHRAVLFGGLTEEERRLLSGWIQTDLGIPWRMQEWRQDGG